MISDKVPCNNGKDCRYVVGYQVDGAPAPLFIITPKNIFGHGVSQYDKNPAFSMSFNVSEEKEWMSQYKNIWNEIEPQLFEKLATEPIKGKYVHGKLKTWKKDIKTNFHGRIVLYNTYCNATAVLKIDSLYKQGKHYHPKTYIEQCKYIDVENKKCNMLSDDDDDDADDDDDGLFEV